MDVQRRRGRGSGCGCSSRTGARRGRGSSPSAAWKGKAEWQCVCLCSVPRVSSEAVEVPREMRRGGSVEADDSAGTYAVHQHPMPLLHLNFAATGMIQKLRQTGVSSHSGLDTALCPVRKSHC